MNELLQRAAFSQLGDASSARLFELPHVHSANLALYYASVLGITLAAFHPVITAVSLVGSLLCSCVQLGPRSALVRLAQRLPMAVLVALANPLFSASGSTLLYKLGPLSVYAESLAWGACMGCCLLAALGWFGCVAYALTQDRLFDLTGSLLPTITLMISMAMRLVPTLVRRGSGIAEAERVCAGGRAAASGRGGRGRDASPAGGGHAATGHVGLLASWRAKLANPVRTANVLVGWALEDSLITADSMRARGWGSGCKRSSYQLERYTVKDAVLSAALLVFVLACAFLAWVACSQFHFYPTMSRLILWWGYLPWIVLAVVADHHFVVGQTVTVGVHVFIGLAVAIGVHV